MNVIRKWLRDGNDCEHCPAGWEERGYDDCDAGCYIYGDEWPEPCRLLLPKFARAFLSRRPQYFRNHEYDDYGEWYEKDEAGVRIIEKELETRMSMYFPCCICHKDSDGKYYEVDTKFYIHDMAWRSKSAYDDFLREPRKTLRQKWAEIISETVAIPVGFIKSYICK